MIYLNLFSWIFYWNRMIETRRLKNVVIFLQTIISFVLPKKIINLYNDVERKHRNVRVKDFRKYEELEYKKNKLKLDIDFLNNCKQLGVYPKFLIFKLPNVSNKYDSSICKKLLCSAINNPNKELQNVLKELSISQKLCLNSFLLLTPTSLKNP